MVVSSDPDVHRRHLEQILGSSQPMTKMDMKGDDRLIPLGWLLRATGLDELPQVINVLRGEMSLVGRVRVCHLSMSATSPGKKSGSTRCRD
jgi:lipopolysaccharide/colanic/teichoic acid biosynthesis glycosyltransferase